MHILYPELILITVSICLQVGNNGNGFPVLQALLVLLLY